ncbi:MAG: hypothetical protein JWL64_1178, partial [Frankiales bacterium]|nr:hypothetical protein [Frankiales bacterium]
MVPALDDDVRAPFLQGPGVCGNDLETRAWAGTLALALPDGARLGVRASSAGLLQAVSDLYADRVVAEDGPALYSLALGEPGRRRAAPMHFLYYGGQVLTGSRDIGRLVRALVWHLSALLETGDEDLRAVGTVLELPDGRLLLAPPELLAMAAPVDRLLLRSGAAVADVAWVALRPPGPEAP